MSTVYLLAYIKTSEIDQTEICYAAFCLHHLPWNLSSPLVLKSSGLRSKVFSMIHVVFSQRTYMSSVTKLTLDDFADCLIPFLLHLESYLV